jgi:fructose-bisphosphate aldolase class II
MAEHPSEFDPRKFLKASMDAMAEICTERYEAFGTAGMGSKIKPLSLQAMYKRYQTGELDPKINR